MANTTIFTANTKFKYQQDMYWVQDADKDYSITMPVTDALRFEVRAGDVWSLVDATSINRSEISSTRLIDNGIPIHVAYVMNLEQGSINTANWAVLGQFHQNDLPNAQGGVPPFSINLNGEKMAVNIAFTSPSGVQTSVNVFSDTTDIIRGHDYAMDINIVFDPNGNGHLTVTRDGIQIVDYTGPLGYSSQQSVYWKEGIYRAASPETMAVTYSNLLLETNTPIAMATVKAAGPQTVNQYSNTGSLLSSTTTLYDLSGDITQKTITTIGTGIQIFTYKIAGESYTSTKANYDIAGNLINMSRYHADGTLDYLYNITSAGISTGSVATIAIYDWVGNLVSTRLTQADGSSSLSNYNLGQTSLSSYFNYNSAGQMTLSQIFNADGSKTIQHWGIAGQAYTSDIFEYDTAGRVKLLKQFYANGTLSFQQSINAAGVTTVTNYDVNGAADNILIIQVDGSRSLTTYGADKTKPASYQLYNTSGQLILNDIFNSDGSRKTQHFGIIGQNYSSDTIDYNAAGQVILLRQFNSDGSLKYQQSVGANNVKTYTNYDSIGGIINQSTVKTDGSRSLATYGANKTKPSSLINYDSAGKITIHQEFDLNGQLTLNDIFNADGSRKTQHFGITGQNFSSDTFDYNIAGSLVLHRQFNIDGSLKYQKLMSATGATTYTNYDSIGGIINQSTVKTDGSRSLATYGANKTKPSSLINYDSAGKITIHQEFDLNGQLTLNDIFNADGSRKTQHFGITGQNYSSDTFDYNSAGSIISHRQFNTDGSLKYQKLMSATGVITYTNYDSVGGILNRNVVQIDGARSLTTYGANKTKFASLMTYDKTGKMTLRQEFDQTGNMTLNDIFNADGTRKTQHFGITGQPYVSDTFDYNLAGNLVSMRQYHLDGTLNYAYSTNTNGSNNKANYDAAGVIIQNITTNTDGYQIGRAFAQGATFISGNLNDAFTSFQADTFIFNANSGKDIIYGFNAGDGFNHDFIQFNNSLVQDFAYLQMSQVGADVSIKITDWDSITLKGISLSSLTAQDFLFR